MNLYPLTDTVLEINGNASAFLNGLTTNLLTTPLNAFVNIHGRIITTFIQEKLEEDDFLIAVHTESLGVLLKHLQVYAKIGGTKIETTPKRVYVDLDSGKMVFKDEEMAANVSEEMFTNWRLDHNWPLQGVDYHADEFILNVDSGQFVSFTKGCFLGQEPVAKVHNRSKPARKLIVKFEEECTAEEKIHMTSRVKEPKTGRMRGFIFVKNN